MRASATILLGLLFLTMPASALAAEPGRIDYDRDVRPILSNHCYACHGPDTAKRKAGLRLDRKQGAFAELRRGRVALAPRNLAKSELYARISAHDDTERMPPTAFGKPLSKAQVATLRRWIEQGATWEDHWAYVPPKRPAPPAVKNTGWARNGLDRFILARLEKEGLSPSPEADRRTLIRRLSFDLTGLPPSPVEVGAFVADRRPDAYERLVDRLLASPHYGERMAQHWLDLARYADTNGYHIDNHRDMWKWREWVIGAFNSNMPFDRFTVEQLAGDLLPGATLDQKIASGFNRNTMVNFEGGADPNEYHTKYVIDRVTTTATVWMGTTIGCAECHDHKYDPFTQKEFYQFFAFFNNVPERGLDGQKTNPVPSIRVPTRSYLAQKATLVRAKVALEERIRQEIARVKLDDKPVTVTLRPPQPGQPAPEFTSLAVWETWEKVRPSPRVPKSVRDALRVVADKRTPQQKALVRDHFVRHAYAKTRAVFGPLNAAEEKLKKAEVALDQGVPEVMVMEEMKSPRATFVLVRGDFQTKGAKVSPGVPAVLPPLPAGMKADRLALAKWLVGRDHPLTARVTVNRWWEQVFGTGLVKTGEDFGSQGEWPSHPELLDWLATELTGSGWDVKAFMKVLVMSSTYRQSSRVTAQHLARDPENRLLARAPRFRLPAEMVRDNALAVSGLLVHKVGGPSVKPYQPAGLWEQLAFGGGFSSQTYVQDKGEKLYRRGMYTYWKRSLPHPSLATFDAPNREVCTDRRPRTNTPLQALVLMNDPIFVECARVLGQRVLQEGGKTTEERLAFAFRLCTARAPRAEELRILEMVYKKQRARYDKDKVAARKLVSVGESPRPAGLDVSELAAWTALGNMLLNLDETITKG